MRFQAHSLIHKALKFPTPICTSNQWALYVRKPSNTLWIHTDMSDKAIYDSAQAQRKCQAVLCTVCSCASGNDVIFSEMPITPTVPLRLQT